MSDVKTIAQIKSDILKHSPHPEKVKLLAVSKKQSVTKIKQLLEQEQFAFGENYVQEAFEKMDFLPATVEWHLIGHLQSKKVNSIIGKFAYIHSVDSLKLARLISEKSYAAGLTQNIFIEVNLGDEASKTGFSITDLNQQWPELTQLTSLRIFGLMALPPLSEAATGPRDYFKKLRQQQEALRPLTDTQRHPLTDLSMGTSQDYPIALQEGSTYIRIGTTLFGERR